MEFAKKHLVPIFKGLLAWGIFKSIVFLVNQLTVLILRFYLTDASFSSTKLMEEVYTVYYSLSPVLEILMISIFLLCVSAFYFSRKNHLTRGVQLYPVSFGIGCHSFLLGICLSVFVSLTLYLITFSEEIAQDYSQHMQKLTGYGILSFIISAFVIPFFEEILYRGLLYRNLKSALPRVIAMICAGFVFAMDHGNIIQKVYAFLLGLLLALLYDITHSLLAPILFHMAYNGTAYLLETYLPNQIKTIPFVLFWQGAFVLGVAFFFLIFWKSKKKRPSTWEIQDRWEAGEYTDYLIHEEPDSISKSETDESTDASSSEEISDGCKEITNYDTIESSSEDDTND